MANGDRNSDFIRQFLDVNLPGSRSAAITPATLFHDLLQLLTKFVILLFYFLPTGPRLANPFSTRELQFPALSELPSRFSDGGVRDIPVNADIRLMPPRPRSNALSATNSLA